MHGFPMVADEDSLREAVKGKTVLALFYADWCGFCARFIPIFQNLVVEGCSKIAVNISNRNNVIWDRFEINVVPTVLLFKDGKVVGRKDGRLGFGLEKEEVLQLVANG